MAYSLGLGLTNHCNLSCAHCYRDESMIAQLSLEDVQNVLNALPLRSVNLGTGENGLHPDFHSILDYIQSSVPKTTITSNGYSIQALNNERLSNFASVEFSIDFPTETEQDAFRGPGNWKLVMEQAARCNELGVPITVTAVMMSLNYDRLHEVAYVADQLGATFRVNIYQGKLQDAFSLSYEQLWEGFRNLLAHTRLVTTTEPVLVAALGLQHVEGCGCGLTTVRLTPSGSVLPCVYLPDSDLRKEDLLEQGESILKSGVFEEFRKIPSLCKECEYVSVCKGGCAGRRHLYQTADAPDPYCPLLQNVQIPFEWADFHDLPKSGSACTTIVKYKGGSFLHAKEDSQSICDYTCS